MLILVWSDVSLWVMLMTEMSFAFYVAVRLFEEFLLGQFAIVEDSFAMDRDLFEDVFYCSLIPALFCFSFWLYDYFYYSKLKLLDER